MVGFDDASIAKGGSWAYYSVRGGEPMDQEKTGALIALRRTEKGMTQKQLAQLMHISHTTVSKWERGVGFPDVSMVQPLCAALEITVTELFSGERMEAEEQLLCERLLTDAVEVSGSELKRRKRNMAAAWAVMLLMALTLVLLVLLWPKPVELDGFYQSGQVNGHFVQISFSADEKRFVEYIDNYPVNSGSFEAVGDGTYSLIGDERSWGLRLADDDSFDVTVAGLNSGAPIRMENISKVYVHFGTFDSEEYAEEREQYRAMLEY